MAWRSYAIDAALVDFHPDQDKQRRAEKQTRATSNNYLELALAPVVADRREDNHG